MEDFMAWGREGEPTPHCVDGKLYLPPTLTSFIAVASLFWTAATLPFLFFMDFLGLFEPPEASNLHLGQDLKFQTVRRLQW